MTSPNDFHAWNVTTVWNWGDAEAECDDLASAMLASRTLFEEAVEAGADPADVQTAIFFRYEDGMLDVRHVFTGRPTFATERGEN